MVAKVTATAINGGTNRSANDAREVISEKSTKNGEQGITRYEHRKNYLQHACAKMRFYCL